MKPTGLERDQGLVQRLGALGLAVAVFNAVVGSGIFVIPATLAHDIGSAAPLAYLACTLTMGAVSLCFAAAGSRVPVSGGPYGYAEAAFGPLVGFVIGMLLWLSSVLAAAGIAAAVLDGLAGAVPAFAQPVSRAAVILAIFAGLAGINLVGVASGTRLVGMFTVAKLAPLLLLVAVCAPHVHPASLAVTTAPPRAFGRAMILALFAFQGMETSLGVSGEVRDPARNVPRGLLAAMGAVAALYVAVQLTAEGVLGGALAGSHAPLVDAMRTVSPPLAGVVAVGAAISMLGYLASDALAAPRLLFAFGRQGLLPSAVGALQSRTRAPYVAILLHTGLAAVLAISGGFTELVILSSLATVIVYAVCCAAAVRLQSRGVALAGPPLRVHGLTIAAAVGILAMIWIALNAAPAEAVGCFAAVAGSAIWYVIARRIGRARTARSA